MIDVSAIAGAALSLTVRATCLIAAAWITAVLLRTMKTSAATRHIAWLSGIGTLLALPLVWWLTPAIRLPMPVPADASIAESALSRAAIAAPGTTPPWGAVDVVLLIYAAGVAALLLRFLQSRRLITRLWRDAAPVTRADLIDQLADVSRELGHSRPVAFRIARGPAMPMTWGTLRPKILLPAEAPSWPPDRRRLVLAHELAHVARRDGIGRSMAAIACALYWFHPGIWFAARRLRLEQEHAADDRVLMVGAPARGYALSLLDLARRLGDASWPDHVAAVAGTCQLERRVLSITGSASRERPSVGVLIAAAVIGSLILLAVAAGVPVNPVPTQTKPRQGAAIASVKPLGTRLPNEPMQRPGDPLSYSADAPARRASFADRPAIQPERAPALAEASPAVAVSEPPPHVAEAAGDDARGPAAPAEPRSVYGPRLPGRTAVQPDFDPRIPAAFRKYGEAAGGSAKGRKPSSRSPSASLLRALPRIILDSSGLLPPSK